MDGAADLTGRMLEVCLLCESLPDGGRLAPGVFLAALAA